MNKKKNLILTLIIAFMPGIVFAETHVYVGNKDIYEETYTDETAKFDSESNTLTLNSYNGTGIVFEGFDEKTINIILEGNNVIDGGEGRTADNAIDFGSDGEEKINANIIGKENSTLLIQNYSEGIYLYDGNMNLKNVNISLKKLYDGGIWNKFGPINIFDSTIDSTDIYYPIYIGEYVGDEFVSNTITIDNLTYTSTGSDYDFYADILDIKNSNITTVNVLDTALFGEKDINIKDSDITITDALSSAFYAKKEINIDGGKIIVNDTDEDAPIGLAFVCYDGTATLNSDITIDYKYREIPQSGLVDNSSIYVKKLIIDGGKIDINLYSGIGIYANDYIINNGSVDINSNSFFGLYVEVGKATFNGGITHIKNTGPAIANLQYEEPTGNVMILEKAKVKEDNLKLVNTKAAFFDDVYIYTFGENDLEEYYDDAFDVMAAATTEVTILGNKKVTFDANGGSGTMDDMDSYDGKFTLPTETTFKEPKNMKLKGWSLSKDGNLITSLETNENTTVYAIWEEVKGKAYLTNSDIENPETGDNYTTYLIVGVLSLIGLISTSIYIRKRVAK